MSGKMVVEYADAIAAMKAEIERLQRYLDKIDELAEDGQNGSAAYAFDRLTKIRKLTLLSAKARSGP